jgi:uncharacterized membrane protein YkvI
MPSPILDTFKDARYAALSGAILLGYGVMLLFFDQFLFFAPYFTVYVPVSRIANLILDLILTFLTAIVLTVSVRQIFLQRQGGRASKTGVLGVVAALLAGACPCYYLIPLLAVTGTVGSALGAIGTFLNIFQIPVKLGAILILAFAACKLNKSGICKIRFSSQHVQNNLARSCPVLFRNVSTSHIVTNHCKRLAALQPERHLSLGL